MKEITLIFLQILFISIFFSSSYLQLNKKITINSLGFFEKTSMNLIMILNIFLLLSFINIDLKIVYLSFFFLNFSLFIINKIKNHTIYKFNIYVSLLILLTFIISIDLANNLYLEWDAKFFWYLKSLNFYENQSFENLKNIAAFDYPHFGSYLWHLFWKYPFNVYEYHGRIFYVFLYTFSIFLLFENLEINVLKRIILILITILVTYSYNINFSGNQEILVFSLIIIATKYSFYLFYNEKKINRWEIILVILGASNLLAWIKNEALFFSLILIFSLLLAAKLKNNEKIIFILGSLLIIILKSLIFWKFQTVLSSFEFQNTFGEINLINILNKIKVIIFYLTVYIIQIPIYLIFVPVIFFIFFNFKIDNVKLYIFYFALLNFLFIIIAFLFAMQDVEWQARVGMKRVLFETSGFYLISLLYLIKKMIKFFK
jgi:hypothetical protein